MTLIANHIAAVAVRYWFAALGFYISIVANAHFLFFGKHLSGFICAFTLVAFLATAIKKAYN